MPRLIRIPADLQVPITEVEGKVEFPGLNDFFGPGSLVERVGSGPLRLLGTDNNVPVLVVDEEGRLKQLPYNERATILYVPAASRHRSWIAGDALVVGEGITAEGPDFIGLDDTIGRGNIEDLIAHYRKI